MAGLIVAYLDLMASAIYFVLTVLALICMQLLREKRDLFQMGTGSRGGYEAALTYREVKHVQKRKAMRYAKGAPSVEKTRTVKCQRCGSVNVGSKTHCMMCGKEL
jgi:rubrerythrin